MGNDPAGKLNKEKSVIFKMVFLNLNFLLFYLHVFLILRQPGKNATDHSKLWLKKSPPLISLPDLPTQQIIFIDYSRCRAGSGVLLKTRSFAL